MHRFPHHHLSWFQSRSAFLESARQKINRGFILFFLVGLGLSWILAACSNVANVSSSPNAGNNGNPIAQKENIELTLVSFSVTQAAHERIIPKFVEKWKQEHNQTVTFKQSYGASAPQARIVIEGQEDADVVHLSLAPDVQKIERAGLINPGWEQKFPNDSIVSKSVVAIVTRENNPKGIKNWTDLTRKGVSVITPNPYTSGSGRWNFLALWHAGIHAGKDEAKTLDFVTQVYQNVPFLTESARQATNKFFKDTQGDVLLTYENEVILKTLKGEKLPYIVPDVNFSIDNPVAVVDKNVDKHGTREVAEAFVQYLYTPEAQEEFVKIGYRPTDTNVAQIKALADKYPSVKNLAKVEDYGGWDKVQKQFFESDAIFTKILKKVKL